MLTLKGSKVRNRCEPGSQAFTSSFHITSMKDLSLRAGKVAEFLAERKLPQSLASSKAVIVARFSFSCRARVMRTSARKDCD